MESLLLSPVGRAIIPHISILTAVSNSSIHFSISLIRLPQRTACLWHISLPKGPKSSFSLSAFGSSELVKLNKLILQLEMKNERGERRLRASCSFHSWRSQTCLDSNSSPLNHRGAFVRLRYLEFSLLGILNTWNSLCGVKMFTFRTENCNQLMK